MGRADVERLRAIVLADEALQAELFAERDQPAFVATVAALAAEHGMAVSEMELWDALADGKANWLATWSP